MNLEVFLSALRARLRAFLCVLVFTMLAATLASLLMPKTYRATASLHADVREEQSLSNVLRPLISPQERLGYLQTQADVITSPKVARMVVRALKLAEDPAVRDAFKAGERAAGSIEDRLVESLLESLKVETSQSSVIRISFSSRDRELSARVANAFAKAYLDSLLELRVLPTRQAAAWFDEQLKTLRANLERAQSRLTDYYRQKGIVSADERLDVENLRLGELATRLARAQDQTLDWGTRERQAREAQKRGAAAERVPDVLNNAHIQKLNADLVAGEAKLRELAAQYGPNHPTFQRQQSENQALRERLDAQVRKVVAGVEAARRQSERREAALGEAMRAQREQLLERKVNRNELAVLLADVETAQRTYDTAMQRFVVSQVESRASQTNVTLLSPAEVPRKPFRPKIVLNIALALAAGILLGVAVVAVGETLDRRVRLTSDLDFGPEVPLLATFNARPAPGRLLLPASSGSSWRALPRPR
jgi:chain length determinant protein EpsF